MHEKLTVSNAPHPASHLGNCPNCNVVQAESFPATENQSDQVSNESRNINVGMEAATYMDRGENNQSSVRQKVNFRGGRTFHRGNPPSRR